MAVGTKSPDAFRTIGEVADELGVGQHILRYWETKFPQLRPLQRAGNRRYYRPADVALARRIHRLLGEEGYTVKGVQKVLRTRDSAADTPAPVTAADTPAPLEPAASSPSVRAGDDTPNWSDEAGSPGFDLGASPAPAPESGGAAGPSPFAARLAAVRSAGLAPRVDLDRLAGLRDRLRAALDA